MATQTIPKTIGPSFYAEIRAANLTGLPFSWGADGVQYDDTRLAPAQVAALQTVYAAHDPTKPAPPLSPSGLAVALDALLAVPTPTIPQIVVMLRVWRQGIS